LSPKFGFFKRKTSDIFHEKEGQTDSVSTVTYNELLEILEREKKLLERDLITDIEPTRRSVLECLHRLRNGANELELQEIKVENPQFESLISNSKRILITSIKKESFIESSEIKDYEDAVKFKNNLELLINRFGQVGDSHNRILNEFMRKQINKLKSEFDNLSSLLKKVTKILSIKEAEINKTIACRDDLVLFREKFNESKNKQDRLSELREEKETMDRNIEFAKREYNDFQNSNEFLNIESVQKKITDKKKEITTLENKIAGMISSLSRPITKFSYQAPKETQGKLAALQNEPLEIFNHYDEYLQLFNEIKRDLVERTIEIKDPEKTIHQVDEIVNSLPLLSSNLKSLQDQLIQLQSSVNSKAMKHLEELKSKTELYEKHRSENIFMVEQIKNDMEEADSALIELKKKIEDQAQDITGYSYSILRSE
jgi:hypothetical protein